MVVAPIIHSAKLNITKSAFLLWDPGLFWAKVGSLLPPTPGPGQALLVSAKQMLMLICMPMSSLAGLVASLLGSFKS
eukprot:1156918-Pelagomonas_calceolata.AAC.5